MGYKMRRVTGSILRRVTVTRRVGGHVTARSLWVSWSPGSATVSVGFLSQKNSNSELVIETLLTQLLSLHFTVLRSSSYHDHKSRLEASKSKS